MSSSVRTGAFQGSLRVWQAILNKTNYTIEKTEREEIIIYSEFIILIIQNYNASKTGVFDIERFL